MSARLPQRVQTFVALDRLGIRGDEARQLVRASATLHTWAEHECNGHIQRDEATGRPYWYDDLGKRMQRTSDREAGALAIAHRVAYAHGLLVYHQTDPRGCALYLYRQTDLDSYYSGDTAIDACYSSVGFAVCP